MKQALVSVVLAAAVFAPVCLPLSRGYEAAAPIVPLDEGFVQTKGWLEKENLVLTGGEAGRDDLAAFSQEAILFYGEAAGNPEAKTAAQREQGARRAAVVVAQRALAEYLNGFTVAGDTDVGGGALKNDRIRSAVNGFIKGSQVVFQEYNANRDTAVTIIKIGLRGSKGFASTLYDRINSDPDFRKELATGKPEFKADPVPLDADFDGLIIDATGCDFRPALINRIFTARGDTLYDPAGISQQVLVEQGCGEYTNSIEKARAALAARGVRNPLILKATASVGGTDLQISDEDAVTVFSADQKGGFLAEARVAFVLK